MATMRDGELESELELEFEGEGGLHEFESGLHEAGLHEFESEAHEAGLHEFETGLHEAGLHEFESGLHEAGLHEFESEAHEAGLHEFETGMNQQEQFFKRITRGIGRFVRRAAPLLKRIASVAAPIVGTAIGGPFGAILGKVASSALGEGEFEQYHELSSQHEYEWEAEQHEAAAHEVTHEIASHELTHHEALAEMMAQHAAYEQHEAQAEAMIGAAVITTLSPRDRRELRRILPHLVRGVAILTRLLRRRRVTRPAVRAVPTIVRRTVQTLRSQAAAGRPITRGMAARAATIQVRRVLGNPTACAAAITQNLRANRTLQRSSMRPVAG